MLHRDGVTASRNPSVRPSFSHSASFPPPNPLALLFLRRYRLGLWKSIWTLPHFSELFTSPEQHLIFNQSLPATEDLVVDRVFSKSYITALGEEERRKLEGEIREVVKDGVGKVQWKGEGEGEGVFEYPYKTVRLPFSPFLFPFEAY